MFIWTHKDGGKVFGHVVQGQVFKKKLSTAYVEDKLYKHVKIYSPIYNGRKGLSCVRMLVMTANLTCNKISNN